MTNLNTQQNSVIWVLVDSRIGNANQAIALAEEIGIDYQVQNIRYNFLAKLPNYILSFFPFHVKKVVLDNLKAKSFPKIIISSGRRTAALALYLKTLSKGKSKIIQIMRPNIDSQEFELIVLPQHDNLNYNLPNIVRIIGALNNIKNKLPACIKSFNENYPELKNFIAVIIGGSSKSFKFTIENGNDLANILLNISDNHLLPLFITFSRRTPTEVKTLFREKFPWPHIIYDPTENMPNPYPAIIGAAEYIISTTDSISMCSEAAGTGKPIYVFSPENFNLKKHKFFIQQLMDLGVVKRLDTNTIFLEKYSYEPLCEITKVANVIRSKGMVD